MQTETQRTVEVIESLVRIVDEKGLPVFGVIEIEGGDGCSALAYKQEKMFSLEDWKKAAEYQLKLVNHHKILADYYSAEFEKRTKTK